MNDETEIAEVEEIPEEEQKEERSSGSGAGLWVVALIALLSFGMSGHLFHRLNTAGKEEKKLEVRMAEAESELSRSTSALAGLNEHDRGLEEKLQAMESAQAALGNRLNDLLRMQSMGNNDWALAEVEHLLIIASHRLRLEKDARLALAALEAADDRLRDMNDPELLSVRQQLASDMNTLKEISPVDISGLALFLSDVVGRVSELPLAPVVINDDQELPAESEVDPAASSWDRLVDSVWKDIRGLVQISRTGEDGPATLAPEQRYFLYQNLRLQLESARYAVLRRDSANLHVSADIIRGWLNRYFDVSDSAVSNIIESVSRMSDLELAPDLPDISSSLETLRAHQRLQDMAPGDGESMNP